MKIVYVSAPFVGDGTKKCIEENIKKAKEYANALASKSIGVFCPNAHDIQPVNFDLTKRQKFFYELDSEFLVRSNALVAIPGWQTSFGARNEVKIAEEMGLPIFYPKSPDDLKEIEDWYFKSDEQGETPQDNVDWDKVIDIRRAMSKYTFAKAT